MTGDSKMARKITIEDLTAEGLTDAQAKRIVKTLSERKPRAVFYMFKATKEQIIEVANAFPMLEFSPRYTKKQQ